METKISIVGSGNVATQLLRAFINVKLNVVDVYIRNIEKIDIFKSKYKIPVKTDLNALEGDIIILCVKDDAIEIVADSLNRRGKLIVHCSGSIDSKVLNMHENFGVIYPIQTITQNEKFSFSEIPVCITANTLGNKTILMQIAKSISNKTFEINDEQRQNLHLSAVFTNNFINHLVKISKERLEQKGLSYEMILPLIKETFAKISHEPFDFTQTGPAKRNDKNVIQKHITLLENNPEIRAVYTSITNSILKTENNT